jgi:hypothetical protein
MECVLEECDPNTYSDAHGQPKSKNSMVNEYHSLMRNKAWDLIPKLQQKNVVKCRWVYNTKFTFEGVVEKHKAHLVAKGFSQQESIKYT